MWLLIRKSIDEFVERYPHKGLTLVVLCRRREADEDAGHLGGKQAGQAPDLRSSHQKALDNGGDCYICLFLYLILTFIKL
jgi:hypothetical protein